MTSALDMESRAAGLPANLRWMRTLQLDPLLTTATTRPPSHHTLVLHPHYETVLLVCLLHISCPALADSPLKELVQEDHLATLLHEAAVGTAHLLYEVFEGVAHLGVLGVGGGHHYLYTIHLETIECSGHIAGMAEQSLIQWGQHPVVSTGYGERGLASLRTSPVQPLLTLLSRNL